MKKYLIGGIQKFSTSDGPGIRTTVFIKGCPLKCRWCHNPEMISYSQQLMKSQNTCIHCKACIYSCPNHCIYEGDDAEIHIDYSRCKACLTCVKHCYSNTLKPAAYPMTTDEIMEKVVQDSQYYDKTGGGVTLSGGEILTHPEYAREMISRCTAEGVGVALDTSGCGDRALLIELAEKCKIILYDMKSIDNEVHKEYTGVSNELILDNLSALSERADLREKIWIRMPLIHGVNDTDEIIDKTIEFMQNHNLQRATLLPYHELGSSKCRSLGKEPEIFTPPDNERLTSIRDRMKACGIRADIFGIDFEE